MSKTYIITNSAGSVDEKLVHYISKITPHELRKWQQCDISIELLYRGNDTAAIITHELGAK